MADVQGTRKRNYSATAIETTLVSSITSAATGDTTASVAVVSVSGFPSAPFTVILGPDTNKEEVVTVTAVAGTTLTITRGQDNTQAVAHAAGTTVRHGISAREFKEASTHMASRGYDTDSAILSNADLSHVHGIATGEGVVVGTDKAQALTNKSSITGLVSTGLVSSSATPKSYVDAILGSATAASTSATSAATSATSAATSATSAAASATASANSASAAATSASSALTSQTAAATSATSAATSASSALTSQTAAATSATSAATSATSAAASATTAAASVATIAGYATTASNSAAAAATSATSAANSATAAATSASSAASSYSSVVGLTGSGILRDLGSITDTDTTSSTYLNIATLSNSALASSASATISASSAATSASSAAASASAASSAGASATAAAASATAAATSATSAANSATAAATSASSALTSQTAAATSATSAAASATTASNSAATATTQAANAATSASSALTSQTAAATSATSAAASATAAATSATSAAASAIAAATSATSAAAAVSSAVPLAGGTMTGFLTLSADPTSALHAVTKQYADAITAAINFHAPVARASTANLTGTYNNGTSGVGATFTITATGRLSLDGGNVNTNDRVLLKNQTTDLQNGIYVVTNQGGAGVSAVLTRSTDYDNNVEVSNGDILFCTAGTQNAGVTFVNTSTNPVTIGTSSITFSVYTSASLPTQTGNAGKYLTTDGTTPSWASVTTDPKPDIFMMMGA